MASRNRESLGQRLLEMKEELEEKKSQRSELQGEWKSVVKQLEEFGAKSLEEAAQQIETEEEELEKMEASIRGQIEELEELMEGER